MIYVCMYIFSLDLRLVKMIRMSGRVNSSVVVLVGNNADRSQSGPFCYVHPPTPPAADVVFFTRQAKKQVVSSKGMCIEDMHCTVCIHGVRRLSSNNPKSGSLVCFSLVMPICVFLRLIFGMVCDSARSQESKGAVCLFPGNVHLNDLSYERARCGHFFTLELVSTHWFNEIECLLYMNKRYYVWGGSHHDTFVHEADILTVTTGSEVKYLLRDIEYIFWVEPAVLTSEDLRSYPPLASLAVHILKFHFQTTMADSDPIYFLHEADI